MSVEQKIAEFDVVSWIDEIQELCERDNDQLKKIDGIRECLSNAAAAAGIPALFLLTGSRKYFMKREHSDLDLVMLDMSPRYVCEANTDLDSHKRILDAIKPKIEEYWNPQFGRLDDVIVRMPGGAKCELIRLLLSQPKLVVDVCLDRLNGIRLTEFLCYCRHIFHMFQPLVVGVKLFFERLGYLGKKRGFPSSCLLACMAVGFLQQRDPPIFEKADLTKQIIQPAELCRKLGLSVLSSGTGVGSAGAPIRRTGNPSPVDVVPLLVEFFAFYGRFHRGGLSDPVVIDLRHPEHAVRPDNRPVTIEDDRTDVVRICAPNDPRENDENLAAAVPIKNWLLVWESCKLMAAKLSSADVSFQ